MAAPTPRVVPGAPPPKKGNKKSKASGVKKQQQGQAPAPVAAAVAADTPKSAALLSSVPKPNQLPDSLKVHPQDLAEQAEKNAAIEAVKVLEANSKHDSHSGAEVGKSAVEAVISKKIKTLTKKIQRISGYETMEESKLNADQRRAISTKPALEMVVQELNEVIKAVAVAQKEDKAAEEQRSQERIAAAKQASHATSQSTLLLLVQFLHIFNLVHPNPAVEGASASFAPPSLPAALEQATGQEIAALAKVFDGLVNAPLSGSQETVDLLKTIEDDSQEEVLEGVTYARLHSIILSIGTELDPSADQANANTAPETLAEPSFLPDSSMPSTPPGLSAPSFHTAFGHSSSSPSRAPQFGETSPVVPVNIRFMQASEILDDELVDESLGPLPEVSSAPAAEPEVAETLAEPEGGGVEEVPKQSLPDAQETTSEAAQRGAEGGKGSTMGGEVHSSALADASNVEEVVPAPTASSSDAPTTATPAKAPALRHLDWATEGDDTLDDLEFALPPLTSDEPGAFPSTSSMGLKAKPNLAPPVGGPQGTQAPLGSAGRGANGGGRRPQANGNAQANGPRQPYVPPRKPQPEVDEDGFILLPSRRAQPQQQQQQRGRGRGGGGGGQRADGRGRGRGGQGGSGGQNRGGQGGGEGQAGGRQRGDGGKNNTGGAGSATKSSAPQARAPTQA